MKQPSLVKAIVVIASALFVLVSQPASASGQKNKDKKITSDSEKSLILMRVPTFSFNWTMSLSRDGKTGFLSRVYLLGVKPDQGYQYVSRSLKPGTYVMTAIFQQGGWQSCYSDKTPKFTIGAGKVYYLGTFEATAVLSELQADAVNRGRTRLQQGGLTTQWDASVAPSWVISGDEEIGAAKTFVSTAMPRTTAKIAPLSVNYSKLKVSNTEKALQICG